MEPHPALGTGQGQVYIYNEESNLRELKEVNLNGVHLFFNDCFRVEDLQEADYPGNTVFLNGELQVRTSAPVSEFANGP
jgi:hypothetical protein